MDSVSKTIEIPVASKTIPGFLAQPNAEGVFPGMVVIQEWSGLTDHLKEVCMRLARQGYVDIGFALSASSMSSFLQAAAPVRAIDTEEGVVGFPSAAVSLLSRAPHPNAARVFINWWFSREGQLVYHEAVGTESIRKGVPNFVPTPGRLIPKKVLWERMEDQVEAAKLQRERVLKNLFLGK